MVPLFSCQARLRRKHAGKMYGYFLLCSQLYDRSSSPNMIFCVSIEFCTNLSNLICSTTLSNIY